MFKGLALNTTYYQNSVNLLVALGAHAKLGITSPLNTFLIYWYKYTEPLYHMIGKHITMTEDMPLSYLARYGCSYLRPICMKGLEMVSESTTIHNDVDVQKVFFGHYPAGVSVYQWKFTHKMLQHPNDFIDFDWGEAINLEKYG